MRTYIIRRLLILIPTLFLLTLVVFFTVRLLPGNIIDAMMAGAATEYEPDIPMLERQLGLDQPALIQYARWMGFVPQMDGSFGGLLQGNFGVSWWQKVPVVELLVIKGSVTLELGIMGLILAQLIALPIGVFSAVRQDAVGDYLGRSFAILCISVPSFWLGTMIIVFPSIWWNYMPSISLIPFNEDPIGNLGMFIIPACILGMGMAGVGMRMTRSMLLEVLRQDYIRTAWAKGLKERVVIVRHALKNALIPIITTVGLQIPFVMGGTVIIEQIFCLPGIGRLIVDAVLQRDEALTSGIIFIFGIILVLVNLAVDMTYGFLDPRVRYK